MSSRSFRRDEPDYASYDSYLRDIGYCPIHLRPIDVRHPCIACEIEQEEQEEREAEEAERKAAIAKDDFYNADGYAVWEDAQA